ncbi:hypothetical protein CNR29_08715 [Levilactobacillus brevis]|uniref:Uncharacterized protein n=1 Tax=Levilactobacillus brevis TaxID=1580 RepID=A0A2A3TZG2_LEVBR|nr:hypothetical protein CNR29_08715 [Levilactobacillus brevis]
MKIEDFKTVKLSTESFSSYKLPHTSSSKSSRLLELSPCNCFKILVATLLASFSVSYCSPFSISTSSFNTITNLLMLCLQ